LDDNPWILFIKVRVRFFLGETAINKSLGGGERIDRLESGLGKEGSERKVSEN